MKALILTCNTGGGHNASATAIKEAFDRHGVVCDIADTLAFVSRLDSKIVDKCFTSLYRHLPKLWNRGYTDANTKRGRGVRLLTAVLRSGAKRLRLEIKRNGYTHVVCVHIFAAVMVSMLKKKHGLRVATSFLSTDYTYYPFVENTDMDIYFLPHEDMASEFRSRGIAADKLFATGIPVKQAFLEEDGDAAAAKAALGLSRDAKVVLIMGGSMGCGPIEKLTEALTERCGGELRLLVACGTNGHLFRRLKRKNDKRLIPFRYSERIPLMMRAADLFVTKPGGISITEAALMGLPTVLLDMVGGCESFNYDFFVSRHLAFGAQDALDAAFICAELLTDAERLRAQSERTRAEFYRNSAEEIFEIIKNT